MLATRSKEKRVKYYELKVPEDSAEALAKILDESKTHPVLVFKKSPICVVIRAAEQELRRYLTSREGASKLGLVMIDVLRQRSLALGLSEQLGVRHESPQAFILESGELQWHGSHGTLTLETFRDKIEKTETPG